MEKIIVQINVKKKNLEHSEIEIISSVNSLKNWESLERIVEGIINNYKHSQDWLNGTIQQVKIVDANTPNKICYTSHFNDKYNHYLIR